MIKSLLAVLLALLLGSCAFAQTKTPNRPYPKLSPQDTRLAAVTKEQARAKAAYMNSLKGTPAKRRSAKAYYVKATMALANLYMEGDNGVPPRLKYPKALAYYREVLKVDPKNSDAKRSADTIIQIYKSMGRPVPGGG